MEENMKHGTLEFDRIVDRINQNNPSTLAVQNKEQVNKREESRRSIISHHESNNNNDEDDDYHDFSYIDDEQEISTITPSMHAGSKYASPSPKKREKRNSGARKKKHRPKQHGKHKPYCADMNSLHYTGPVHADPKHHAIAVAIQTKHRARKGRDAVRKKRAVEKGNDHNGTHHSSHCPQGEFTYWVDKKTNRLEYAKPKSRSAR